MRQSQNDSSVSIHIAVYLGGEPSPLHGKRYRIGEMFDFAENRTKIVTKSEICLKIFMPVLNSEHRKLNAQFTGSPI